MSHLNFACSLNAPAKPFPHFWEHTVGSGHATLALRADWQKQLSRCRKELGFRHVRFHGLLDDDMGTLMTENDKLVYSFYNANQICDFLLSIDMKPFMELSFMPSTLSSAGDSVFHYKGNVTPPKNYAAWGTLIKELVENWVLRYGIEEVRQWFFEIWNEPNLKAFWTGSQSEYFKLYEFTAKAIKNISPQLQVGGPATSSDAWIPQFLKFCKKNKVPVDFVSTHHYPTDAFGKPGDDTLFQLAASHRSVLKEEALVVSKQAKGKPLYYTEWSTSSNPFDDLHDLPYASAFIIKTVMEARGIVEGYSYWTFSDIFEENYFSSVPFHGGFGLMNVYGIPKPAYRAFELLHKLGDELLPIKGHHSTLNTTVDIWATRKGNTVDILMTNSALPKQPIKTETVKLTIHDVKKIKRAQIERIDDDHSNPRLAWEKMGSPEYLSLNCVKELEVASALVKLPFHFVHKNQTASAEVSIPPQGTPCKRFE